LPRGCGRAASLPPLEVLRALRPRLATRLGITAVPQATISVMPWLISPESQRIMTTASAPQRLASATMRSMACARASCTVRVKSVISPSTIELSAAPSWPTMLRLSTVIPKTSPSVSTTSWPATASVVAINIVTPLFRRCAAWRRS